MPGKKTQKSAPKENVSSGKKSAKKPLKKKVGKGEDRQENLRRMLLGKRHSLIKTTEEEVSKYIKGESRQIVENTLDGGDSGVIDLSEDLTIKRLSVGQDTIEKIDESIRKLDEGTYGLCNDCGDAISAQRLKILPFAIRCRDCQEDHEELQATEKGESIIF